MQFLAVLFLAAGLVSAQTKPKCLDLINRVPEFAKNCINASAKGAGCTGGAQDLACLCKNYEKVQVDALPCVQKQPGIKLDDLINQAKAICDCQNGK